MKAFPSNHDPKTGTMQHGMELRDYFAAAAVMGLGANPNHVNMDDEQIAKWSYNLADAMMKARDE